MKKEEMDGGKIVYNGRQRERRGTEVGQRQEFGIENRRNSVA